MNDFHGNGNIIFLKDDNATRELSEKLIDSGHLTGEPTSDAYSLARYLSADNLWSVSCITLEDGNWNVTEDGMPLHFISDGHLLFFAADNRGIVSAMENVGSRSKAHEHTFSHVEGE